MNVYLSTARHFSGHRIGVKVLLVILAGLCCNSYSVADTSQGRFSLSTRVTYDDNPQLLSDELKQSVWRGTFVPLYEYTVKSGAWDVGASASITLQQSSDELLAQNREDPSVTLSANRVSDASEFAFRAAFTQASTRITEFEDTNLVARDGTREGSSISASYTKLLSARSSLSLSTGMDVTRYEGSPLVDFTSFRGVGTYMHQLSEQFGVSVALAATEFDPEDPRDLPQATAVGAVEQQIYSASIGFDYRASERFSLQAQAGAVEVDADLAGGVDASNGTSESSDDLWNASVNMAYTTDLSQWSFAVARSTNASGLGRTITADSMQLTARFELSDTLNASATAGWRRNNDVLENESFNGRLSLTKALSEQWGLSVAYEYRERSSPGQLQNQGDAAGNVATLSLDYSGFDL